MYVRKLAESGSRTQFLSTDVADNTRSHPLWKEKKCHQHFVFYFILFFRFPLLLRTKNIQIIPQKIWWYIFYNTGRILSSFHN
jgi:hypothetical protein